MILEYDEVLKDFFKCVKKIKDANIRRFVYEGIAMLPEDFWIVPASSSKKFHPSESNIEPFGLLVHTIKVIEVAEGLMSFFDINDSIEKDIIRAALILHDGYKGGYNEWVGLVEEHGYIAVTEFKNIELDEYIKYKLLQAIETHMSRWSKPWRSMMKSYTPDKLQRIVALSDFIASRRNISFYPGRKVLELDKDE